LKTVVEKMAQTKVIGRKKSVRYARVFVDSPSFFVALEI
jgi:hypothetical protein